MSERIQNIPSAHIETVGAAAGALIIPPEMLDGGEWKSPFLTETAGEITTLTLGDNEGNAKERPGKKRIYSQWLTEPFSGLPPLNT